jgi:hypothetical protein
MTMRLNTRIDHPSHPESIAATEESLTRVDATARRPPIPNSHPLVKVEKYEAEGDCAMYATE